MKEKKGLTSGLKSVQKRKKLNTKWCLYEHF